MINGPYVLTLNGQDSLGRSATAALTVRVEGEAKPGAFTFTVQDLVIPVAGYPIALLRTYSTLTSDQQGDFGYGWKASFSDLDIRIDEERIPAFSEEGNWVPIRSGAGGRDVTLTLPDGRRTTFAFGFDEGRQHYEAKFTPPAGVNATLTVEPRTSGWLTLPPLPGYCAPSRNPSLPVRIIG